MRSFAPGLLRGRWLIRRRSRIMRTRRRSHHRTTDGGDEHTDTDGKFHSQANIWSRTESRFCRMNSSSSTSTTAPIMRATQVVLPWSRSPSGSGTKSTEPTHPQQRVSPPTRRGSSSVLPAVSPVAAASAMSVAGIRRADRSELACPATQSVSSAELVDALFGHHVRRCPLRPGQPRQRSHRQPAGPRVRCHPVSFSSCLLSWRNLRLMWHLTSATMCQNQLPTCHNGGLMTIRPSRSTAVQGPHPWHAADPPRRPHRRGGHRCRQGGRAAGLPCQADQQPVLRPSRG